ncbi:hypothetical protein J8F10_26130 [Gemmata sp. G18]|uniref:DUF2330 domain-containing protein n=1 Tax=Gemmata palustris TaxID=2822762 RepID=A0ABS5BYF1_9BACT|nr:hypothetical protein [Gemmata palustris]MBP3958739.1 hypothetical protein [Gemmata palustris]
MSGWVVRTTHPKCQLAAFAVVCAFVCGSAPAQPTPGSKNAGEENPVDTRDPLPPDTPRRKTLERLQIPGGHELAIYTAIEDFKPVARQDKHPREYDAWINFVLHAKNQSVRELNEYAIRDLVPLDLTKSMRGAYRTDLIRFDGKLTSVRRLVAPQQLQQQGVTELFEARFVPIDESPTTPVSIVFLELPESLSAVRNKNPEEWLEVEGWVTASGYFFKAMSVPGDQGNAVVSVPLLIGKGLTPLAGPPVPIGNPVALDKKRLYEFIKDDTKMIRSSPTEVTWPEVAAYNRVILHASRFSAEELESNANTDLKFADLFKESRLGYKLACVKFEGRLLSLRRIEVNDWLSAAGVTQLFEGWMIPASEPRGNPICVVFSEPLPDMEPTGRVNAWVTFAGFSFKRMRYESAEPDEKNPGKNLEKYAPLLIGRGPVIRTDPNAPTAGSWGAFVRGIMAAIALLILSAGVLAWWYRGGDRRAKSQMAAVRNRNPFDTNVAPPA